MIWVFFGEFLSSLPITMFHIFETKVIQISLISRTEGHVFVTFAVSFCKHEIDKFQNVNFSGP